MRSISTLVLLLAISGCVTHKPLNDVLGSHPAIKGSSSTMMIVEFSEDGAMHHPGQVDQLTSWLSEQNEQPLLVYVHGWHHNADRNDENLKDFRKFVHRIGDGSRQPVKGLYIGWRGDSFDIPPFPEPIDFLSIWGRKAASTRLGTTGLKTILEEVRKSVPKGRALMMGHSLGASALFYAIRDDLKETVADGHEYILMNPAASSEEVEIVANDIRIELASYATMNAAALDIDILRDHRKILILQALGDTGVSIFYRIAFRGVPVGFDGTRTTHSAKAEKQEPLCDQNANRTCDRCLADGRFLIQARGTDEKCQLYSDEPVWIVPSEGSVSKGHNDIFNDVQGDAIISLIEKQFSITVQ